MILPFSQISGTLENPTLLHFAARFGLEKMSWQLLECPGADIACDMKNVNGSTPADLAEQAGFSYLAHQLKSFRVTNVLRHKKNYSDICMQLHSDAFFLICRK